MGDLTALAERELPTQTNSITAGSGARQAAALAASACAALCADGMVVGHGVPHNVRDCWRAIVME